MKKSRETRKIIEEMELLLKKARKIPFSQLSVVNHDNLHNVIERLSSSLTDYERLYDWSLSLTCSGDLNKLRNSPSADDHIDEVEEKDSSFQEEMMENFEAFKYQYQEELDRKFTEMQETLTEYVDNVLQDIKRDTDSNITKKHSNIYSHAVEGGSFYDSPNMDFGSENYDYTDNGKEEFNAAHKKISESRADIQKIDNKKTAQKYSDNLETVVHNRQDLTGASVSSRQEDTEDRMLNFINTEFFQNIK